MQLTRGSVFLVFLVVFVGCQTPFQMGRNADDPDDRYGLKPGNAAANLDSDNVYTRPQRTAPSENPAPPDLGSTVRLKPFRSTQRPSPEPTATPRPRISPSPTPKSQSTPGPIPKPKPTPKTEDAVSHDDSPPTEPASNVTTEKAPFASPVPGKKGYVTSPFSPGAGFIDVTGMEPGTEAKDPYTGKVFRVP